MSKTPKVEIADLEVIKQDRRNANKGNAQGDAMIRDSIAEFGFAEAGTLDRDNVLIGGNKRTEQAGELGMTDALIIDVDGTRPVFLRRTDLSLDDPDDDKARRLAYALNRTGQVSLTWDNDIVLDDWRNGIDMTNYFDKAALEGMAVALERATTASYMRDALTQAEAGIAAPSGPYAPPMHLIGEGHSPELMTPRAPVPDVGNTTPMADHESPYVQLSFACDLGQRDSVMQALNQAKAQFGVHTSMLALLRICEAYLDNGA